MSLLNYLLPRAATIQTLGHPGAGIIGWLGGAATTSGAVVNEDTAFDYSPVFAATRLLSSAAGNLPVILCRGGRDRALRTGGREAAKDHPVFRVVYDEPNPTMRASNFRRAGIIQQINAGNAYAEIERDGAGRPIALWPIHHSRVKVRRDGQGLYYEVMGGGQLVAIPKEDMLHVPSPVCTDGISGIGIITHARETIGAGLKAEEHAGYSFANGGVPRTVLIHPKTLPKPARDNLREEWQQLYGGTENAGKTAILWEGMDLKTLSVNNEDAQFISVRGFNVTEIARWYGVPPHMIGDLGNATFSNIEHQGRSFVQTSLTPIIIPWEEELDRKLLTQQERDEGYYFYFNVDEWQRGDSRGRAETNQLKFMNGMKTQDECRAEDDLPPLPDGLGKRFFVPANLMLAEDAGKQAETAAPPGFAKAPPPDDQDQEDVEPADKEEASLPPFARDAALTLPPSALARLYKPAAVNRFKDEWFAVPDLADDDKPQAALHCMGHAVDGTTSVSPAWLKAWGEEIRGGKLSEHARINSREGFAEFCRLAWMDPMTADREFPGCFAVLVRQHLAYRDEEMKVEFKPTINIPETVVHVAAPVVNVAAPAITVEAAPAPHVNFVVDTQSIAAAFAEATQQGSDALTSIAISQDKIANREMPARTIEIKAPSGQTYSGKAENT